MLGGTALLLAVAALILFLLPRWIERRRHLQPLTRSDAPAVVDELSALAREAELGEEPRWLWNPLDPSPTGLAFGRPGNHAIALNGGLVTRQFADPPAFRAVVRHELAHLRNHDVDLTYATISLWYAFLLVGVLPFAVTVLDEPVGDIFALGWRLLALALLVYLTRNAVLRAREVYADVRASVPDGEEGALRRILGGLPQKSTSLWRRLWRVHPDGQTRLSIVNDTRRLFPLGLLVAFGTGIATTVAFESMVRLLVLYVTDPIDVNFLAALVFAPLAMGAVGIGIWRGSWARLAEAHAPPPTWPLALAFAAGLLLGPELALERIVPQDIDATLLGGLPGSIPWIAALIVGLVLLLAWVGASGEAWMRALAATSPADASQRPRADIRQRRPRDLRRHLLRALLDAGSARLLPPTERPRARRRIRGCMGRPDLALPARARLLHPHRPHEARRLRGTHRTMALPTRRVVVEARAGGRRSVGVPGARRPTENPVARTCLPRPLARGHRGGRRMSCCASRPSTRSEGERSTQTRGRSSSSRSRFSITNCSSRCSSRASPRVVAAVRWYPRDLAVVAGMAAAFTTGVIATAGIVVGPSLAGCVDPIAMNPGPCAWEVDASFSWFVLRQVVGEGAVVAVAGGLVVLGVQAVLHRRHAPVPAPTA